MKRKKRKSKLKLSKLGIGLMSLLTALSLILGGRVLLKSHKISQCKSAVLSQIIDMLGPIPEDIKDRVMAFVDNYCRQQYEEGKL